MTQATKLHKNIFCVNPSTKVKFACIKKKLKKYPARQKTNFPKINYNFKEECVPLHSPNRPAGKVDDDDKQLKVGHSSLSFLSTQVGKYSRKKTAADVSKKFRNNNSFKKKDHRVFRNKWCAPVSVDPKSSGMNKNHREKRKWNNPPTLPFFYYYYSRLRPRRIVWERKFEKSVRAERIEHTFPTH